MAPTVTTMKELLVDFEYQSRRRRDESAGRAAWARRVAWVCGILVAAGTFTGSVLEILRAVHG